MKKAFKLIGFVALSLIVFSIIIAACGGPEEVQPKGTTIEKNEPKKEEPKKAADPINQENYDKIVQGDALTGEGGMTIEEVEAILGKSKSEIESQSGDMVMKTLTWTNLKFESITVSFMNGKVSSKAYLK